jgi:hypothetical protein
MRARFRRPGSIHRTLVDRDLGAPADCGRCHQFNFPVLDRSGRRIGDTGEPMQNTVAEVAEHLGERAGCLGCHGEDGAGHRFPGSHDPEMLERALEIELCRDAGALALALENRGAAHRVPSGGVHRFIVARLWKSSAPERLVELRLGRRFAAAGAGAGKRTVADTTLAPGERRRLVARATDLGGAAGEPVNAEVTYVYTLREDALLPGGARNRTPIARLRSPPAKLPRCGE